MITQGNKGALAEHCAIAFLLAAGFDVYRNVSAHGPVDLIAIRGEERLFIDVKTGHAPSAVNVTDRQRGLGVKLLIVDAAGGCSLVELPDELAERECDRCGQKFKPRRQVQRFCTKRCNGAARWERKVATR